MNNHFLVFFGGISGAGKTSLVTELVLRYPNICVENVGRFLGGVIENKYNGELRKADWGELYNSLFLHIEELLSSCKVILLDTHYVIFDSEKKISRAAIPYEFLDKLFSTKRREFNVCIIQVVAEPNVISSRRVKEKKIRGHERWILPSMQTKEICLEQEMERLIISEYINLLEEKEIKYSSFVIDNSNFKIAIEEASKIFLNLYTNA